MKKICLFLLVLFSVSAFSQNFVKNNKQWNVHLEVMGATMVYTYTEIFMTSGDTVVNELVYNKLYYSIDSLSTFIYRGALREEGDRVFYLNADGEEGLLYDFGMEAGDTCYVVAYFDDNFDSLMVVVDSVDYTEVEGIERKRMWIHNEDDAINFNEYWIEGIGSINGPLYTFIHCYLVCPWWQLSCCYESGDQIFQHDFLDCYVNTVGIGEVKDSEAQIIPNPIKAGQNLFIELQNNELISGIEFKDLTGKSVARENGTFNSEMNVLVPQLPKGVYMLLIHTNSSKVVTRKILIN
jgi:hypothetical protein